MRRQRPEVAVAAQVDLDAGVATLIQKTDHTGIGELGVDQSNPAARASNERGEAGTGRVVWCDDQAVAQRDPVIDAAAGPVGAKSSVRPATTARSSVTTMKSHVSTKHFRV